MVKVNVFLLHNGLVFLCVTLCDKESGRHWMYRCRLGRNNRLKTTNTAVVIASIATSWCPATTFSRKVLRVVPWYKWSQALFYAISDESLCSIPMSFVPFRLFFLRPSLSCPFPCFNSGLGSHSRLLPAPHYVTVPPLPLIARRGLQHFLPSNSVIYIIAFRLGDDMYCNPSKKNEKKQYFTIGVASIRLCLTR